MWRGGLVIARSFPVSQANFSFASLAVFLSLCVFSSPLFLSLLFLSLSLSLLSLYNPVFFESPSECSASSSRPALCLHCTSEELLAPLAATRLGSREGKHYSDQRCRRCRGPARPRARRFLFLAARATSEPHGNLNCLSAFSPRLFLLAIIAASLTTSLRLGDTAD